MLLTLGFSINVLTMFGMVLVVGIVVDDAIVVVENVERIMSEEGLPPREATRKAMGQISGAIVGVTVVLISVFVPLAFFTGAVGNIYRQFSVVMAASIGFSAFLALSLTPALCATLLKPVEAGHHHAKSRLLRLVQPRLLGHGARLRRAAGAAAAAHRPHAWSSTWPIVGAVIWLVLRLPTSFLPNEDQGYIIVNVQLPPGATANRTLKVMEQVEGFMLKQPEVKSMVSVLGFSFSGQGQNAALAFVTLKDWDEREGPGQSAQALAGRTFGAMMGVKDAFIFALEPAADPRAGQCHRLQLPPAGPRRQRPRRAGRRAQPAARHGRRRASCSPACAPTAWRTRRSCASTSTATRRRAGRRLRRDQRGHLDRLRLDLRQRLPEPGPAAARGGAGRRRRAHAARRHPAS